MTKWMCAAALALGLMGTAAMAEPNAAPVPSAPLTLERVFASPAIGGRTPRAVRLSPDGKWVEFVSDRDGWDHVYVAPSAGGASPSPCAKVS